MLQSKLRDVRQFLSAFVDEAARRRVQLIACEMEDDVGNHCLMGELYVRSAPSHANTWMNITETLGHRLGIHPGRVLDLIVGWDSPHNGSRLPYERLGGRLRARYKILVNKQGKVAT